MTIKMESEIANNVKNWSGRKAKSDNPFSLKKKKQTGFRHIKNLQKSATKKRKEEKRKKKKKEEETRNACLMGER